MRKEDNKGAKTKIFIKTKTKKVTKITKEKGVTKKIVYIH